MPPSGFTLGDHTFLHPSQDAPAPRPKAKPRQILGAQPPAAFDGILREAPRTSPAAKALLKGKFCGHGEPTMTVFDVVLNGQDEVEVSVIAESPDGEDFTAVVARVPGEARWIPIYRRVWDENGQGLVGVTRAALTRGEAAKVRPEIARARVAIGFEYPSDADSRDCVSWMAIDALFEGRRLPLCLVSAELM